MKILGLDFTSSPKRSKPITCAVCSLKEDVLQFIELKEIGSLDEFSILLNDTGPWVAGIDLPFGQSKEFIRNIGWPTRWAKYVSYAESLGRSHFEQALREYADNRPRYNKLHRRKTDVTAQSLSPQKLDFVPVAKMFFAGAPRLIRSGVLIPHMQRGDPDRIVVEAYPKIIAKAFIGRTSYKSDERRKQTPARHKARRLLLERVVSNEIISIYGFEVDAPVRLADDPSGDQLDALLCAIQAAWSWTQRDKHFGAPEDIDPTEGWIADPSLRNATQT